MRRTTLVAIASLLATASAYGEGVNVAASDSAKPAIQAAKPTAAAPAANPVAHAIKPAPASTPESRSAAALALTHEPTFDEGTAERIKEAALSYSDLAVRGGWPTIPTEANSPSACRDRRTICCGSGWSSAATSPPTRHPAPSTKCSPKA